VIAIGNDHAGVELKNEIIELIKEKGLEIVDFGVGANEKADYPNIAEKVSTEVAKGNFDKGILICGTGVGMAITANKIKGIRAVVCSDVYSAVLSRQHNDTNVLCIGQRVMGSGLAKMIVEAWLEAGFDGGRHENRVNIIKKIEDKFFNNNDKIDE
jgi:ribose 5-phosphate isomerase B